MNENHSEGNEQMRSFYHREIFYSKKKENIEFDQQFKCIYVDNYFF